MKMKAYLWDAFDHIFTNHADNGCIETKKKGRKLTDSGYKLKLVHIATGFVPGPLPLLMPAFKLL